MRLAGLEPTTNGLEGRFGGVEDIQHVYCVHFTDVFARRLSPISRISTWSTAPGLQLVY